MADSGSNYQQRFDALSSALEQIVVHLNAAGEVTDVRAGDAQWLHPDVLLTRTFSSLFSSDISAHIDAQIESALASREPQKLLVSMNPEHSLDWREAGLTDAQVWDTRIVAVNDDELLWIARDIADAKRSEQKAITLAQRDPLTGAYNRRALMTILKQSVAQAKRYDWVCSFLKIDIDHFSDINSTHGLDAGDRVLQAFVQAMQNFKRTADFFARFSDDAFVMFLPETNHDQALLAAERVRRLAENLEIDFEDVTLKITVCIGSATLQDAEDSAEDILKRAEENLFIAKQSGSNRIEGESEA
ncbi:sensor domain-containing diguanylate cyclase [Neptunomonas sp. XY-337]|uniref:GGDEF domain-containing protein n=1 Tax=Neptunomonas sp. XY-337 TaxID=2561897 RepID=UPI0010A9B1A7|nr:sensor domain-containing diguanylate cyclase [Neptunomonas sp. XY-337]